MALGDPAGGYLPQHSRIAPEEGCRVCSQIEGGSNGRSTSSEGQWLRQVQVGGGFSRRWLSACNLIQACQRGEARPNVVANCCWTQVGRFETLSELSGPFLLMAAILFVVNIWGRVRELGKG